MPLTTDRPDYTASQLNLIYETIRDELALNGPESLVGARAGITAIGELQISDDPGDGSMKFFGPQILEPQDIPEVIQTQIQRLNTNAHINLLTAVSTTTDEVEEITIRLMSPSLTFISTPTVWKSGPKRGSYKRGVNSVQQSVPRLERLRLTLSVPAVGATNYYVSGAMNTLNSLIGDIETFSDFVYTPFTATIGEIETFDDWPTGRNYIQPTEPYQMLFTSSTLSAASLEAQINGSLSTFTVPAHKQGSLRVYWNGVRQTVGSEVTDNGTSITTTFIPQPGDALIIDYQPL